MSFRKEEIYIVEATAAIDRKTDESELAWDELTNHHAIPYVKEGMYKLSQFWLGYSDNPYENLKIAKEDYGDDWVDSGVLGKVIADYVLKIDPTFEKWNELYIHVTW
jgi:hypothetical protein